MKVENQTSLEMGSMIKEDETSNMLSDKKSEKSSIRNIITICIIALVAFTYGLGLMTPIVEQQSSRLLSPELTDTEFNYRYGIAAAMILAGGGIGHTIYEFFVCDSINNKEFLIIGSILNLVGFFTIYFYPHVYLIGAVRLIMGLIAGFAGAIVPNAIYRLAPEKWRGFFISFYPASIVFGLLIGQILSYLGTPQLFYISHFTVCGFFAFQTLLLFFAEGINEKKKVVKDMGVMDTIRDKKVRRSLVLALIFHIAAHLSGINFVTMFFNDVLAKTDNPYLYGVVNLAVAFVFKFFCGYLCDLGGRKVFFTISCLALAISLMCMHIVNIQHIVIGVYMMSFNLGLGCVPWIVLGEIFPSPYTKSGTFIAVIVNWSAAFCLTIFGKIIFEMLGDWVYYIFSGCIVVASLIIAILFKETKGQKEAQLQ